MSLVVLDDWKDVRSDRMTEMPTNLMSRQAGGVRLTRSDQSIAKHADRTHRHAS